jgi:response regulator RpfG family c-di-GMP phosphodiesterase
MFIKIGNFFKSPEYILDQSGKQFDPRVVEAFMEILGQIHEKEPISNAYPMVV